ncbi:unnamed protein product [Effrenium voratum]|uniref:Pseudouridine synthase RsuA/RluA-like domain-containing protein n=1 Tax=Effrenium voratum TaxID=2562239 RepID=A0AA36IZB5_9DINO|nr:unnamed protein product [Effrenium voratum]
MDHHFASSWLKSLSNKLESLAEWSWVGERQGATAIHRNLFKEFFSAPFQKTLALVDEQKKEDFLRVIERNLHKFDPKTQQFPLGCLCALLQHGKDSPTTQDKVVAWVDFILDRLLRNPPASPAVAAEVAEECLSVPFQRLVPLMRDTLRESLADGLGEHALPQLDEATQKRLLDGLGDPSSDQSPLLPERIEALVVKCTEELNSWLFQAPQFPATALALADALARAEHPLLRFFTAVRQAQKKEAFLVAVALCLHHLRTRFRWMCLTEPVLERLSQELQQRLFFVPNQGPVMEVWLSSRLKKYNGDAGARIQAIFAQPGVPKLEPLKAKLLPFFPQPVEGEGGWLSLDGPSLLADAVLEWLAEGTPSFFPRHCLSRETLLGLLKRTGRWLEVDMQNGARLSLSEALPPPPPATGEPNATSEGDVDNLIDLLMKEALAPVNPEMRARVQKLNHGVYRVSGKEVTLHTFSGQLYVYRIGDSVQHKPVKTLLVEEGLLPPEEGPPPANPPQVDTSSVVRIAQISQLASAGAKPGLAADRGSVLPFGLGRPQPPKQDPHALISKRIEAASAAAEIAKQVLRRQIDFEDEEKLRKLLIKGCKYDQDWLKAYQEYCSRRRVSPDAVLTAPREFMATFVEQNLPNSINLEWAQKVIQGKDKKEKKDKTKDKKDKKEKDKKKEKKRELPAEDLGALGLDGMFLDVGKSLMDREIPVRGECVLSEFLTGRQFLLGQDLTLADIGGVCAFAPALALLPLPFPTVRAWVLRCLDHPAFAAHAGLREWISEPAAWPPEELGSLQAAIQSKGAKKPLLPGAETSAKVVPDRPKVTRTAPKPSAEPPTAPKAPANRPRPAEVTPAPDGGGFWGAVVSLIKYLVLGPEGSEARQDKAKARRSWRNFYPGPALNPEDPAFAEDPPWWTMEQLCFGTQDFQLEGAEAYQFWDVEVLQDTGDYVAIFKPAGVAVSNSAEPRAVATNCTYVAGQRLGARPGQPCHRLDMGASGVQVFAKSPEALQRFRRARALGQARVQYVVMVEGCLAGEASGAIDVPLLPWQDSGGRDLGSVACGKDGLPAATTYHVLGRWCIPGAGVPDLSFAIKKRGGRLGSSTGGGLLGKIALVYFALGHHSHGQDSSGCCALGLHWVPSGG